MRTVPREEECQVRTWPTHVRLVSETKPKKPVSGSYSVPHKLECNPTEEDYLPKFSNFANVDRNGRRVYEGY
jgi:hypothetical protein